MDEPESLPSRGAWIEISIGAIRLVILGRRSPHGERGLKCPLRRNWVLHPSRSPHGERGL